MGKFSKSAKSAFLLLSTFSISCAAFPVLSQGLGLHDDSWRKLDVGMVETGGLTFTSLMPADTTQLRSGVAFSPSSAIDCTDFTPASAEYLEALKRGAKVYKLQIQNVKTSYYAVLALCKIHRSAQGPASRAYSIQVPADYVAKARDGFISVVGEKVAVARSSFERPGQKALKFSDLFRFNPNSTYSPNAGNGIVQEDLSWIIWLTDRGPTFIEAIPSK